MNANVPKPSRVTRVGRKLFCLYILLLPLLNIGIVFALSFAVFNPVPWRVGNNALLTITPSKSLNLSTSNKTNEGIVWLGLMGSCSRYNKSTPIRCTQASFNTNYTDSLSVLPTNAPSYLLQLGSKQLMLLLVMLALICAIFMFGAICLVALRMAAKFWEWNNFRAHLESLIRLISPVINGCVIMSTFVVPATFVALYCWYDQTRHDFNAAIQNQKGPNVTVSIGPPIIAGLVGSFCFSLHIFHVMHDCRRVAKGKKYSPDP